MLAFARRHRLATWMSIRLVGFTLAGSLLLVLVFRQVAAREERQAFDALVRANAAFLDRSTLPQSAKMAAQLGEILGARVWFETADGRAGEVPEELAGLTLAVPSAAVIRKGWLVAGQAMPEQAAVLVCARPQVEAAGVLRRPDTWLALVGFWLLAGLLGVVLARRVAGPLSRLAAAVPGIAEEAPLPVLPVGRGDEIGELARRFEEAHAALNAERERRRAAERLALLGRMTASLAHEVRNPLAAIRLHAQLLRGALPEAERETAALIEAESARIEALVGQWLHFARPTPPVLVPVELAEVVAQALRLLAPQAEHAGVRWANAAVGPAWVAGDAARLAQALQNLVLNAIQAMPRGGELRVALESGKGWHCLHVEDAGRGFSAAALEQAGEAFFSEREGGMGLGLTVAAETARAHGGRLRWENRSGGGARVTLELPALARTTDAPEDAA